MGFDYARPTSDVSIGAWLTQTDAPGPLWEQIDETTHSESDYAYVSLAGPQGIPDQVGNASGYTTANGTQATIRRVAFGGNPDDYHSALLAMPAGLDIQADVVIVNHFHGATGNEYQIVQTLGQGVNAMLDSWLDAGFAVISHRLGTSGVIDALTDNDDGKWGNAPMRAGMLDAIGWMHNVFTVHPKGLLFYGFSAGGVNSINALMAAHANSYDIAAVALSDPALNLRSMFGSDASSGIHTQIQNAYALPNGTKVRSHLVGAATATTLVDTTATNWVTPNSLDGGNVYILFGTGAGQVRTVASHTNNTLVLTQPWDVIPDATSWYCLADVTWIATIDTAQGGHDPMFVDLALIPDIPMMLNASPTDTSVKKQRNADQFVARLTAAGWTSELNYTSIGGQHGSASHFRPAETLAFYQRALAV